MINRNYESLKFKRTYVGGSKEKELQIFMQVQNINGECDWIEYRRILFPYLEDVMHVAFSRSFLTKRLSFILLGFSFLLGILHLPILSIITVILSILFRVSFIFFERTIRQTLSSYNLSIDIVKNEIKNLMGFEM
jgi:hypothetical protein